jgi:hypothetical protein
LYSEHSTLHDKNIIFRNTNSHNILQQSQDFSDLEMSFIIGIFEDLQKEVKKKESLIKQVLFFLFVLVINFIENRSRNRFY